MSVTRPVQPPSRYFPFKDGRYETTAGLYPFGHDFGNHRADQRIFQIDRDFDGYREEIANTRFRQYQDHVLEREYDDVVATEVVQFIAGRLAAEYRQWFSLSCDGEARILNCALTSETIVFTRDWTLDQSRCCSQASPPYTSAWDALASQVQEDLAVTCVDGERDWLAALHVCLPSHWLPAEKIGRNFAQVHAPVPGMKAVLKDRAKYVGEMIHATGGMVRFVWGLQADKRLNCHPSQSAQCRFDPARPQAFVRVERQTIWGLPRVGAALFTIRPYLVNVQEICADKSLRGALTSALQSMSDASLHYKGLDGWRDELLNYLSSN